MAFFAGKTYSISIGASVKPLDKVELSIDGEAVDVTNFLSGGWRELLLGGGVKSVDITASGPYNGVAVGATAGDHVTDNVVFIFTYASGPAITLTAQLDKVSLPIDVKGAGQITYTAKSTGVPTLAY